MRLLPLLLLLTGCKDLVATIVGGTISTGKEIASGVKEGVVEGRKQGESVDGAAIVTTLEELHASGGVSVYGMKDGAGGTDITLAFENTSDRPMRVSQLDVLALDKDGFAIHPSQKPGQLTVPPRAKEQLVVLVPGTADRIAKVRVWGEELSVPAP